MITYTRKGKVEQFLGENMLVTKWKEESQKRKEKQTNKMRKWEKKDKGNE